jgi:hypothetical protein
MVGPKNSNRLDRLPTRTERPAGSNMSRGVHSGAGSIE